MSAFEVHLGLSWRWDIRRSRLYQRILWKRLKTELKELMDTFWDRSAVPRRSLRAIARWEPNAGKGHWLVHPFFWKGGTDPSCPDIDGLQPRGLFGKLG